MIAVACVAATVTVGVFAVAHLCGRVLCAAECLACRAVVRTISTLAFFRSIDTARIDREFIDDAIAVIVEVIALLLGGRVDLLTDHLLVHTSAFALGTLS